MSGAGDDHELTFASRLRELAGLHSDAPAVVAQSRCGEVSALTWKQLAERSNQVAWLLQQRGVGNGSVVCTALTTSIEHYLCILGCIKLGAVVLPLSTQMDQEEGEKLLGLADPVVTVADWTWLSDAIRSSDLSASVDAPSFEPPDRVSPGFAATTGGTSGPPSIVFTPSPLVFAPRTVAEGMAVVGIKPAQIQLVTGSLHHTSPFFFSLFGLFLGHTLITLERFRARDAVRLISELGIHVAFLTPTFMREIAELSDVRSLLRSLETVIHTGAPCARWVKRRWIEMLGAERVYESLSCTEGIGMTVIRGDEWLQRPGSVGRPMFCEVMALSEERGPVPPGEVGELFMRIPGESHLEKVFIGSDGPTRGVDGYLSVGDLGWLDEAGYLYLVDRKSNVVVIDDSPVYPAVVEEVLMEHPSVADVAVLGIADHESAARLHAIVELRKLGRPPTAVHLRQYCVGRLPARHVPQTYEFIGKLPRDGASKIRRAALIQERQANRQPESSSKV